MAGQEEKGLTDEEGREREVLYERAERMSGALVAMGVQLREAIEGVNAAAAASMGDPNQPLGKLVRILNNQLQALTHMDSRTDDLAGRLDSLSAGVLLTVALCWCPLAVCLLLCSISHLFLSFCD